MVAKLRPLAALGALVTALVVVWQSAPPANVGTPKVQLRSTAAPMDPPTTTKSGQTTFRLTTSSEPTSAAAAIT